MLRNITSKLLRTQSKDKAGQAKCHCGSTALLVILFDIVSTGAIPLTQTETQADPAQLVGPLQLQPTNNITNFSLNDTQHLRNIKILKSQRSCNSFLNGGFRK